MKTRIVMLVLAMAISSVVQAQSAPKSTPEYHPLRPVSECLRPDRLNQWYVLDNHTIIAKAGPDRYLVKLQNDCPRLGIGQSLRFRANQSNKMTGWGAICGESGETVRSRDEPPCAIQSVSKIDKAEYDKLEDQAVKGGFMTGPHHP
ncbi:MULTISPECIES: DUF6491 family protein [Dyella]|uniref:Uncharacterized protein n=2 Tax=Dyella TaxID=231454 RepID=A0A4R0YW37_9GAMM|nr:MULTISPECIES: DUF6491 family protein [Dyella]TBR38817.1 hypothetical protein EYV96_00750 [Dyella terrae]TCI13592.1 hypothetical protein EZM97_10120 [Dyella soli]